jgi:hypothetical protein
MNSAGHRWRLSAFVTGSVVIGQACHTGAESRKPTGQLAHAVGTEMTCPREEDVTGSLRPAAHPGHRGTRTLAGSVNPGHRFSQRSNVRRPTYCRLDLLSQRASLLPSISGRGVTSASPPPRWQIRRNVRMLIFPTRIHI